MLLPTTGAKPRQVIAVIKAATALWLVASILSHGKSYDRQIIIVHRNISHLGHIIGIPLKHHRQVLLGACVPGGKDQKDTM